MANPNLISLASLYGKTSYIAVSTTAQNFISNPVNSNQVFKINVISVTNTSAFPVIVTLQTIRNGIIIEITSNIVINPQVTVKLNNKNNFMYLEEGDTLQLYANTNNAIQGTISYEIISSQVPGNSGVTYSFSSLPGTMYEGTNYTVVVNTTGVADNTTLYWTNAGTTSSNDIVGSLTLGGLYGQFFNGDWRSTISTGNIGTLPLSSPTLYTSISYGTRGDYYGFIAIGYFIPPTTGTYTFYTSSDDGSGVWVGDIASAASGRTTANAVLNNNMGAGQGDTKRSGTISLTAGQTYPIRIVHEEVTGGDNLTFSWAGPGISETTNLAQYFYYSGSGANYGEPGGSSGSVVIRNNSGSFPLTLKSDSTTETGETVILQLRTTSIAGTIVATSNTIQASDPLMIGVLSTQPALNAAQIKAANPNVTDGNYWYQPTGTSTPILCYTNFSSASTGKGFVLVARGRESLDWWNNAGQNTSALTFDNLNTNTPIAVASSDFVNGLIGSQWSGMRLLCNRINIPDSWLFTGVTNTTFSWAYWNQSPSSVSVTSQRYTGLNMTGSLDLNYSSSTQFTDTLNLGGGNNCQRSFTWTWGSHGGYQGWSGGSSCNPTGNFQAGSEGHSINLVNVYVEC